MQNNTHSYVYRSTLEEETAHCLLYHVRVYVYVAGEPHDKTHRHYFNFKHIFFSFKKKIVLASTVKNYTQCNFLVGIEFMQVGELN